MRTFKDLKKNISKDRTGLEHIKIAFLGDSATQFLVQAVEGYAYEYGINAEIFEGDFDQIELLVFDPRSELFSFGPDIVVIFYSAEKSLLKFRRTNIEERRIFADAFIDKARSVYGAVQQQNPCKVIFYNLCEIDDAVFGSYGNKTTDSFIYQVRKINFGLMELCRDLKDLYICDLNSLQSVYGRERTFASNIYINTELVFSLDFLPLVAGRTLDIVNALRGKVAKCVVLDLDNTLWGGVIGDDGIENIEIGSLGIGKAFTEFQLWLKGLKERGIILAVCSKNTESVAKEVFLSHPDMVLRMEDIAIFVANWDNKPDNIRAIQAGLNIGFESMVFLDDNPFERNFVKEQIPALIVPELPEDPADFLSFLYSLNLFETASYSEEDSKRTGHYQLEAARLSARNNFTDESSYLAGLEMLSDVQPFNKFNIPRVAQLSQRSNQFNLRTIRYTEADIERISESSTRQGIAFTLEDKFGDNGLICVVILERQDQDTAFINTWFMSCRVLKRGMEAFVLNTIAENAQNSGYSCLKGEFIATGKNELVRDHYKELGFRQEAGEWLLELDGFKPLPTHIKRK